MDAFRWHDPCKTRTCLSMNRPSQTPDLVKDHSDPTTQPGQPYFTMTTYEFFVIEQDHPDWQNSHYKGRATVRAETEAAARALAVLTFTRWPDTDRQSEPVSSPWLQPEVVGCRILEEKSAGEPEVISPVHEKPPLRKLGAHLPVKYPAGKTAVKK